MFKRILVAVDGSKTSLKAMDKAIELQQLTDAEIYLLCVYKHHSLFEASLSIGRPPGMDIPDKVLSEYAKEVVNHAKDLAKSHGATKVRGFVKGGRPSKVIIKFAQDKEAT
ncbi:universal stress protein [Marinobacter similis]|uniref:universal stress protein n=1 Tax=Marinobacter similis TaxID=1420916 RepID=UPI000A6EAFAC|nr:universal stress protein [Marinobacter similis]